jgi:Zn-dependent peptidase ImmA (M78 family)
MTDSNPMKNLYVRLEDAGISESYVRAYVLPEWWRDEIAESSTGFLEAIGYIAKHLGVEPSVLRDEEASLSAQSVAGARFKLRADVDADDVTWAQSVAVRAGEMAAYAIDAPFQLSSETSASSIRNHILETGARWVDLEHLLSFCWDSGLPVLHVPEVPGNKMDGMVVGAEDRPVIVLSKDHSQKAWLLFILAHELGHIVEGHLERGDVLVDEEYTPDSSDPREREADRFAVELLSGDPEFEVGGDLVKAEVLAEQAREFAAEYQIAPGAAVLNFTHNHPKHPWPLANATLNELRPDANAPESIRSTLRERLDWSSLPNESADFLARVTGLNRSTEPVPVGS